MFKTVIGIFSAFLMSFGLLTAVAPAASACPSTMVFGIGGVSDGNSGVFAGRADVLVKYSGKLNDIEGGVSALKRDIDAFRSHCGGTKLVISGYSQGAAIAHIYAARHGHSIGNAHLVLYSDPKRPGGEADGIFALGGGAIRGTDNNYGGVPTLQVCYLDDIICNRTAPSGWLGYKNGKHANYNFNPRGDQFQAGERLYW